jgi:hypothetical protein
MANLIEILLKSNSGQVTTELGKVDKALGKTEKSTKSAGTAFGNIGSSIATAVAGYLTLQVAAQAVHYVIDAAAEAEVVQSQLNAVLKSTGEAAGMTADDLNNLADELSYMAGVDDELILRQEAVMLTFTKISRDIFPQAMEAALNLSAALGQDLQSSVVQIGKALNDPIQGVTALRRVGVMLTDQQEDQIKVLVEQNKLYEAQQLILQELETEFGGAAEAMGDTYTGSMNRLKTAIGNVAEEIGGLFIPKLADAATALELLITWNDRLTKALGEHEKEVRNTANSYDDYIKEMERAANVAGFEINAQGDLVKLQSTRYGVQQKLIEQNFALSESEYQVWYDIEQTRNILDTRRESIEANRKAMEYLADEERWLAEQEQILKETMEELSVVMGGALGNEMDNYGERLSNIADDQAELMEQFDETKAKIRELQDELSEEGDLGARKKLREELEQEEIKLGELNDKYYEYKQAIADAAEEHAKATRKIIFDILQQQLAMDGLTQAEADALVSVAGKWGLIDKETQDAWNAIADYIKSLEGTSVTAEGVEDAINNINGGEPMVEFKTQVDEAESALGDAETAGLNMGDEMVKAGDKSEKSIEGVINKVDTLQEKLDRLSSGTYSINLQTTKPTTTTVYDFDPYYDLLGAQGVENFVVPPGYSEPYNPFTVGLSSGEQLNVTPAGESGGGGGIYVTVNVQQVANDIDVERAAYRIASVIYDKQHGG